MNLPTLQQAIESATNLMKSDDAISSVVIQFQANGIAFEAIYSGTILDVKRIA